VPPTTGSHDRSRAKRGKRGKGRGIEHFGLGDKVGFRLSLSVQPLHGCCTERGAGSDGQHDLVLCIHDAFLSVG
jgi:hypothetical protein